MLKFSNIPYGKQSITEDDIKEVCGVLLSDFITQGPNIPAFEKVVTEYCHAKYGVAVCNATSALHLACKVLGLKEGDYLWTSPNTFVASANCGLYCGAKIDFVDIDPKTYNMCVDQLSLKLAKAQKQNCLPKIVIPVHFAGQSCEMEKIKKLSDQYGFKIIEDASHAIGGYYQNHPIGACLYSDITIFSFHPVKIITTGEGGMLLTNEVDYYEKLLRLRSHGITRNQQDMTHESEGDWYYQQLDLGFNYRMTDIQAALGRSQMSQLNKFIERRKELVNQYFNQLNELPITLPWVSNENQSAWHLYVIQLKDSVVRKKIFNYLRSAGIFVNVHYIPVHLQPYYRQLGFKIGDYVQAEHYYERTLSLPLYYDLTDAQQQYVIDTLKLALK